MSVPWKVYETRCDAIRALGSTTADAVNDAGHRIATPPFLEAYNVCDTLCIHYDGELWTSHASELPKLLRSLLAASGLDRVVLDFRDREHHVGTASMGCIYCLHRLVTEMRGRFALCGLTKDMLEFFGWHDRERISFPAQTPLARFMKFVARSRKSKRMRGKG